MSPYIAVKLVKRELAAHPIISSYFRWFGCVSKSSGFLTMAMRRFKSHRHPGTKTHWRLPLVCIHPSQPDLYQSQLQVTKSSPPHLTCL
nr:uncharacterized protein CTRU02_05366 [Colletotrichum truncatum]KAF6794534.1 hypothetical protein CTRU02_05366 [Colletotrichum truncatum]